MAYQRCRRKREAAEPQDRHTGRMEGDWRCKESMRGRIGLRQPDARVNWQAKAAAQTNASGAAGTLREGSFEGAAWLGGDEEEDGEYDGDGSQYPDEWMQKVLNSFGGSGEGGGGSLDNTTLQNV